MVHFCFDRPQGYQVVERMNVSRIIKNEKDDVPPSLNRLLYILVLLLKYGQIGANKGHDMTKVKMIYVMSVKKKV